MSYYIAGNYFEWYTKPNTILNIAPQNNMMEELLCMDFSTAEERYRLLKPYIYLPLFYLIPDEIAQKRKLDTFPRCPLLAVTSKKWSKLYHSKNFQTLLMDTWGWMMWQCLGIKGGVDNYSNDFPFVRMVFDLPMWAWIVDEMGINTAVLANVEANDEMPFLTLEQAAHNCDLIAKRFWEHPALKMREMWEIVSQHMAHEDYSKMPSHVKMDFHRKYNHTRAKISTESFVEDDESAAIGYAHHLQNDYAKVESKMWLEGFTETLGERDREIAELLMDGYSQEEIAKILGYASHSGVSKRLKSIRTEFQKFRQKEKEWEENHL